MKISQLFTFVLLGAVTAGLNQVSAQAPVSAASQQSPGLIRVFVVSSKVANGRPANIFVVAANDRGMKFKTTSVETTDTTLPLTDFERYFVYEPVEFREAYALFQDRMYPEAIKAFRGVADMQKGIRDLPFSYAAFAEFYIAEAHRRMMNAAEMDKVDMEWLKKTLPMEGCLVQMDILDIWKKSFKKDWASVQTGVQSVLKARKNLSSGQRAQLLYLLALSYDAQNKTREAIDAFAESMLIDGIGSPEISKQAILKSLDIYMKNPELVEFFKTNPKPDAKIIPGIVREAAGLAGVWKSVFNFEEALPEKYNVLMPFRIEPPKPAPVPAEPAKDGKAAPAPVAGKDAKAPAAAAANAPVDAKKEGAAAPAKPEEAKAPVAPEKK